MVYNICIQNNKKTRPKINGSSNWKVGRVSIRRNLVLISKKKLIIIMDEILNTTHQILYEIIIKMFLWFKNFYYLCKTKLNNMENLYKMTLKQLIELFNQRRAEGYVINPDLIFNGFKGRLTKSHYIWGIQNQIKR